MRRQQVKQPPIVAGGLDHRPKRRDRGHGSHDPIGVEALQSERRTQLAVVVDGRQRQ
jgi:hypothetical protein